MEINKLIGGLNTDVNPSSQPSHTVRDMRNLVPMSKSGNLFAVENSDGNELTDVVYPEGFQVIGHSVLNTDIIVILANPNGSSQVGLIQDIDGWQYTAVAPVDEFGVVPNDNSELAFSYDKPVDCVSRKLINGDRMLYFTDNNRSYGRLSIDKPPSVGTGLRESSLVPDIRLPRFDYEVIEGGGNFRPGKIHIVTRYGTESGGTTFFGIPSRGIDVFASASNNFVQGGYTNPYVNTDDNEENEDPSVSKSYRFEISNIDTTYSTLEVFVLYYDGNSDPTPKATRVAVLPINDETISYTLSGIENEVNLDVSIDEIFQSAVPYTRAKCIEQKDNTLFLGNLSSDSSNVDLQEIANAVKVKYKVKKLPYSGREGTAGDEENNEPIFDRAEYISSSEARLSFLNGEIDESTIGILDVTNYNYIEQGTRASGSIEVDLNFITDGMILTIGGMGNQNLLSFVLRNFPSATNEIQITNDENSLANNIADAIVNDPLNDLIIAQVNSNTVTLTWAEVDESVDEPVSLGQLTTTDINGSDSNATVSFNPSSVSVSGGKIILNFDQNIYLEGSIENLIDFSFTGTDTKFQEGLNRLRLPSNNSNANIQSSQDDYINEVVSSNFKGYRRGEIYSLGFCLLYNNGSTSPVFHIPGNVDNVNQQAIDKSRSFPSSTWGGGEGYLGTYVSRSEYPNNSNFPGNETGDDSEYTNSFTERFVRHHYIPELKNEPHINVDDPSAILINAIGLEYEFEKEIPEEALSEVREILFVRESRSRKGNKSIYSQGILNKMVTSCETYNEENGNAEGTNYTVDGNNVPGGVRAIPMALGLVNSINWSANKQGIGSGNPEKGLVYPGVTSSYSNPKVYDNHLYFQSPETVFGIIDGTDVSGGELVPGLVMEDSNADLNTGGLFPSNIFSCKGRQIGKRDSVSQFSSFRVYNNYNNAYVDNSYENINISKARSVSKNKDYNNQLDSSVLKLNYRWINEGVEIITDEDVNLPTTNSFQEKYEANWRLDNNRSSVEEKFISSGTVFDDGNGQTPHTKMLFNLKSNNNEQYGNIGGEYFLCDRRELSSPVEEYLLNLSAVNQDFLSIPQTEKVYNVPATGVFRFGIKIKVASTVESRFKGLLGYDSSSASPSSRFSLFINPQGLLAFSNANDSVFASVTLNNFEQDYAGQIVEINGEYFDGGLRMLINGNIEATSGSIVRPSTINSNIPFRIGMRGNEDGTGITTNSSFNGEIYSWFIGDDVFNTIQDEGFETVSNLGTVATGQTSNSGGITYWDNNVINPINNLSTYSDVFGGDTYITKFALNNEVLIDHYAYARRRNDSKHGFKNYDDDEIKLNDTRRIFHSDGRLRADQSRPWETGHSAVEQTYMFVESDVNTYLRHRLVDETRTYVPIDNAVSVYNNNRGYQGDSANYNSQYSFGELFKRFFTTFNTQVISKFENRIIYSSQASNDETLDAYRIFKNNDYYDLPSHTGPIWDLFVSFNTLYAHTPKSLWRTFAEPSATLDSGSIGDVLLGTGSLFQRPSTEVITTEGGYGGTLSQYGGVHCPVGYIFPDLLQKRIFALVNGGQLQEISRNKISVFLSETMGDVIGSDLSVITTDNAHNIDNPYRNIGMTGGYDYRLKLAYIHKHGTDDSRFTLGLFTDSLEFTGFYDYNPSAFVQFDDRMIELKDSEVYEANQGEKNTYYVVLKESIVEIVSGSENQNGKTFDNVYIDSERYVNGLIVRDSFNQIKTSTIYNESNLEEIIVAIDALDDVPDEASRMSFANDEFRMSFPRTKEGTRIKGDHAIVRLVYNKEGKFIVKQVFTKYRYNNR